MKNVTEIVDYTHKLQQNTTDAIFVLKLVGWSAMVAKIPGYLEGF